MAPCASPVSSAAAARLRHAALALLFGVALGAPLAAQDRLTVDDVGGLPGQTIRVPVYVRDVSGTTLDEGDGADLEIQGFAFRADFPATWVTSVNFEKAGVTAGKTHVFWYVEPHADHVIVLFNFDATTNGLAFTLNRASPGDVIGNLVFGASGAAPLETEIPIALDTATAYLVNDSATLEETDANAMLALTGGRLTLTDDVHADGFENGDLCGWSSSVPAPVCP